jgi:hypothetical protein
MDNLNAIPYNELFKENKFSYAMAFVPFQKWQNIYDTDVAFSRWTIFADLDKPFLGEAAVPHGR